MTSVFVANYALIGSAAGQLDSASSQLGPIGMATDTSWLGSGAVSAAVVESTRIRAARSQAVSQLLALRSSDVRAGVSEMIAVDRAAAQAAGAR